MSRLRCLPSRSACASFASACALHSAKVSIPILPGCTPGHVHKGGLEASLFKIDQIPQPAAAYANGALALSDVHDPARVLAVPMLH